MTPSLSSNDGALSELSAQSHLDSFVVSEPNYIFELAKKASMFRKAVLALDPNPELPLGNKIIKPKPRSAKNLRPNKQPPFVLSRNHF